ncbi:MAG: hypothetical protein CSA95_03670 [Bacteroidetes bacterium]|nr:MAG: hypothetical protein CSA95_03670 [Bacteroidota bacterium]PIE87829.1 MAG: hypothetical protein CSA04_04980 [Bacteroidota bacterium]
MCKKIKCCPRCGGTFVCGAKAPSCWCEHLVIPSSLRKQLALTYKDCVCEKCLLEMGARRGKVVMD